MLDKLYFGCFLWVCMSMACSAMSVDSKCEEPMTEGEGEQHLLRYFFSSGENSCIPFFYKGEGGNFNNFESDRDCMRACSQDSTQLYPEGELVCSLPVDVGECYAMHLQYYYSVEEKTCRLFHYGGCKGNGNRFDTRDECLQTCRAKSGRIGGAPDPSPDATTVDRGLIVGVLGGVIFAVAVIASIAMFVVQRKGKANERKRVPTEVEMS